MARLRAVATFKLHNEDRESLEKISTDENELDEKFNEAYKSWLEVEYPSELLKTLL